MDDIDTAIYHLRSLNLIKHNISPDLKERSTKVTKNYSMSHKKCRRMYHHNSRKGAT